MAGSQKVDVHVEEEQAILPKVAKETDLVCTIIASNTTDNLLLIIAVVL